MPMEHVVLAVIARVLASPTGQTGITNNGRRSSFILGGIEFCVKMEITEIGAEAKTVRASQSR
jgi:hypothetical protein